MRAGRSIALGFGVLCGILLITVTEYLGRASWEALKDMAVERREELIADLGGVRVYADKMGGFYTRDTPGGEP
jgi:hypothetical protein